MVLVLDEAHLLSWYPTRNMASADWNTIASDLQRAVNNLVWFVLESKPIPEQPPAHLPLQQWPLIQQQTTASLPPPPPPPTLSPLPPDVSTVQSSENTAATKKRPYKNHGRREPDTKKPSIGEAFDKLVAETLV